MTAAAILVAAGAGLRMNAGKNKIFLEIAGRSILERSLALLESTDRVDETIIVTRKEDLNRCREVAAGFKKVTAVVRGGERRHESEFAGLQALAAKIDARHVDLVFVHDAARPLASAQLIDRLVRERGDAVGCIPGLALPRSVVLTEDGWISGYPENLWAVQTPQLFEATWLLEAHNKAARQGFVGTDTASVIEWAGGDVRVIEGEADNIKITTAADLDRAELIIERSS